MELLLICFRLYLRNYAVFKGADPCQHLVLFSTFSSTLPYMLPFAAESDPRLLSLNGTVHWLAFPWSSPSAPLELVNRTI